MAYTSVRALTIPASVFPNVDQANFPFPVSGTFAWLADVAHGGVLLNAPYDLAFFSDLACTTMLKFKRLVLDATTGRIGYMVKLPNGSHTVSTVIYVAAGNAAVTTDQQDGPNTYNANLACVYDYGDGVTLDVNDSTAAGVNLTNHGATAAAGPVAGAAATDGSSTYLDHLSSSPITAIPMAISAMFYPTSAVSAAIASIASQTLGLGSGSVLELTERANQAIRATEVPAANAETTNLCTLNAWNHGAARFITSTNRAVQINGTAPVTNATSSVLATVDSMTIGARRFGGTLNSFMPGRQAHTRFFNVDPGADWFTAEFNAMQAGAFSIAGAPCLIDYEMDMPSRLYRRTRRNIVIPIGG